MSADLFTHIILEKYLGATRYNGVACILVVVSLYKGPTAHEFESTETA